VFYLSVAQFFAEAIQQLGAAGMLSDPLKTRLVVKTLWSGLGLSPDAEPSGAESLQRRASLPDRPLFG